jgi:hypothetical protein
MAVRPLLPALLLLAGCARSEDASIVVDPNELQAVEQVRNPEQDDEEIAIGEWRETLQDDQTALEFGPTGAAALFSLRCDARRSVFLQRHGILPAGDLPMMLVTIGSETRRLAVTSVGGAMPMLRASLAPSDTLIPTLSRAATPIVIRVGDAVPLVLPPGPAISGFLESCESGAQGARAPGGNEAVPANQAAATNATAPAER